MVRRRAGHDNGVVALLASTGKKKPVFDKNWEADPQRFGKVATMTAASGKETISFAPN